MKLAHHYRTLGLRRGASYAEVKQAYRQLVRKYHPDLNPDQAASEQFHQVNVAYRALCEDLESAGGSMHGRDHADGPFGDRIHFADLKITLEKLGLGRFGRTQPAPHPETQSAPSPAAQSAPPTATPPKTSAAPPKQSAPPAAPSNRHPTASAAHKATAAPSVKTNGSTAHVLDRDANLKQAAYQQLKDLLKQQKFPRAIALVEGLAHRLPDDAEIIQWQAIVYQRWGRRLIKDGRLAKAERYLTKALQTDPTNPSLGREVSQDLAWISQLTQAR